MSRMSREELNKLIMQACERTWNEKTCKEIEQALSQEPTYYPPCIDCNKKMDEIRRAYDKLKEQEPCTDAVSRDAVLDETIRKNSIWNSITNSEGKNLEEIIFKLPSVTPTCEEREKGECPYYAR